MFSLPVGYKHKKSAWMDEYGFKDWFVNEFVSAVKKTLEKSENTIPKPFWLPTQPEGLEVDGESGIQCYFLPPHVTGLIQPMDQGEI